MKLYDTGVYLQNGQEIIPENQADLPVAKEEAAKNTIAYSILKAHNKSDNMEKLQIKFDKLTSHDITFVGIIQTARASGLEKFPVPYVLTNCHNSLCAVGGTINEDDHMFGLTCAKKYGGVYVPPHQAVIHQFAREMLAGGGKMILGSDSHTRYGALGTMAMGEGGPELVKQLLCQTYDINMPGVVAIYLKGAPRPGVGPQDVALAIIGEVFANGYVKNKKMNAITENSTIPSVGNLLTEKATWLYFCTWYDNGQENFISGTDYNDPEKVKEMYQSDYCITLSELPDNLYSNGENPGPTPEILWGDADCDGKIYLNDAVLVMQAIGNPDAYGVNGSEPTHITEKGKKNADVSETGDDLTNRDALAIQKYLLHLGDLPEKTE